jgi:hypothetical protein
VDPVIVKGVNYYAILERYFMLTAKTLQYPTDSTAKLEMLCILLNARSAMISQRITHMEGRQYNLSTKE